MQSWPHDLPIRRKLILALLAASGAATLLAFLAVVAYEALTGRSRTLEDHVTLLAAVVLALLAVVLLVSIAAGRLVVAPIREYSRQLEERVEKRTRELEEAQEQLLRQERLAFLGQLAGGVSHELRRPLSTIGNSLYYLKTVHAGSGDDTLKHLEIIRTQIHGMDKIIHDLLGSLRVRPQTIEKVELAPWLAGVLARLPPPDAVEVRTDVDGDLPAAWLDATQMEQVLSNLVTNAYQAMPEGGELRIRARTDDGVVLVIEDTGCGIPEEHLARVFEPLFTTKARGVGLGLTVSKNFVEASGGRLEVASVEGGGSTFTLHLPTMAPASAA